MAVEIVDLPIKNGGFFHGYVTVYQGVSSCPVKERGPVVHGLGNVHGYEFKVSDS